MGLNRRAALCIGALASLLAFANPAFAEECEERPRYAAVTAEVSARARAEVQIAVLSSLSSQLRDRLGNQNSATARVDARYAVAAAGGFAQSAYDDTIKSYFCALRNHAAGNAAQLETLRREERAMRLAIDEFFDAGLWQPGSDGISERRSLRQRLTEATAPPPVLPAAFVNAGIPSYNFDRVSIYQIVGDVSLGPVASAGGCAGLVRRSIQRVRPEVLSGLQNVRTTVVSWLSGDRADAMVDMWIFVASNINVAMTSNSTQDTTQVTPQFLTCLDEARRHSEAVVAQADAADAAAATPPAQPAPTPATQPAATTPSTPGPTPSR